MPWLTGDEIPTAKNCRVISVPDDPVFIQAVNGALLDLTYAHNWEQLGDLTPTQQANAFDDVYIEFSKSRCDVLPVGMIMFWLDPVIPDNWLICDGGGALIAEWPELFAHWGYKYNEAPNFFGLPDMRKRSPYGVNFNEELDTVAGSETHTLVVTEIPAHGHNIKIGTAAGAGAHPHANLNQANESASYAAIAATGGGLPHNNLHPIYHGHWLVYAGRRVAV